ncbi:hypothetical protein CWR48_09085 [Oceanobacillus arenosus]|uniref:Competence protein ComGF n=1 Tax=Oceanobacillus arenosus TaxID=1229153 RepID=A0A3D8PSU5_9BACI|nr:competence type IV pilus minor pilin ComGF [Oceanobacillus arenosus]RDW19193.1 hypothetical protein CWR48_09085 [Oceanobacillus arenosus]
MLNMQKKRFVYTEYMHHEHGFTFISMLFAIAILSITLPFTGYLLKATASQSNYEEISVYQFFQFVRDEVVKSTGMYIANGKLHLQQKINNQQAIATIEKYESLIRRQVDGTGHEIFLRDVQDLTFFEDPYGIKINVTTLEGNTYDKRIIFYE